MSDKSYKVSVDQNAVDEDFFNTFGSQLSDAQIDQLTSGFRGPQVSGEIDPASIDPLSDPVAARTVLFEPPKSELEPSERPFVLPLVQYLDAADQHIPPDIKVLNRQWDFYLVRFGLNAIPRAKERFGEVELRFSYHEEDGCLSFSLNPDSELEDRFAARASVTFGITPSLGFSIPSIQANHFRAGGDASADLDLGLIYKWECKPLRARVVATGVKSSYARWIISASEPLIGSVELSVVLGAPKGRDVLRYEISGRYEIDRGWAWWKKKIPVTLRPSKMVSIVLP